MSKPKNNKTVKKEQFDRTVYEHLNKQCLFMNLFVYEVFVYEAVCL